MRVISGKAKGTQLKTPSGRRTRPITNLAKEAIFSILENTASCWDHVLDLYAGSGALGIEALSRKAEWADFVDRSRRSCGVIKYNLDRTKLSSKAHIYCCKASKSITFLNNNYNIVFMDPPYSNPCASNMLAALANSELIEENSTIVVCHANRFPLNLDYDGLHLIEQRRYGDTFISLYQKGVKR
jgi:16S rRNA (guanine(966)-N(2))-methyltransferase RsmD